MLSASSLETLSNFHEKCFSLKTVCFDLQRRKDANDSPGKQLIGMIGELSLVKKKWKERRLTLPKISYFPRCRCCAGHELLDLLITGLRLLLLDQFHLAKTYAIHAMKFQSSIYSTISLQSIGESPGTFRMQHFSHYLRPSTRISLGALFCRMMICFKRIISLEAGMFWYHGRPPQLQ